MTIEQSLRAITNYPIPQDTIYLAGIAGGVSLDSTVEASTLQDKGYLKAERYLIRFLLIAPGGVSEQGVSFSIGESEKSELRERLSEVNRELDLLETAEGNAPKKRPSSVAYWSS